MSYPGYPNNQPAYPPYPDGGYPQQAGYPPQYPPMGYTGYNQYPPPPTAGFNVGPYPVPGPGYPPGAPPPPHTAYPPGAGFPPMGGGYPPTYPYGAPNPAAYNPVGGVRVEEVTTTVYHPSAPYNPAMVGGAVAAVAVHEEHEEHKEEKHEEHKEEEHKKEEHKEEEHKEEEHKEEEKKTEGTVKEHHPFEPKEDAAALKKAMKGLGTKEKVIIDILANRTFKQRHEIAVDYKTLFGKDLVSSLKKELGGHFEDAIVAMMTTREKYLATCLHSAIAGAGTKDRVLIEILCSATNEEIHKINEFYQEVYGRPLEKAIAGDTSGYFQKLLVAINVGNRDENHHVSHEKAVKDAEAMFQAGEKKMGTNESVFSQIIVSQSYPQLRAAFEEYEKLYKHPIEDALKKEMSGDLQDAMLALVQCIKNKEKFFAQQIYKAIKGLGTKDHTLIRVIITRSEIDLKQIKEAFEKEYKKSLESVVKSEAGGDYRKVLEAILK